MSGQEFYPMFSLGQDIIYIFVMQVNIKLFATIKNSFASAEAEARESKNVSKEAQKEEEA